MHNTSTCLAWNIDDSAEARAQQLLAELGTARKKYLIVIFKRAFPEWYAEKAISENLQVFLSKYKRPYSTPPPSKQPSFINWTLTTDADKKTYELFLLLQGGIKDATLDLLQQSFPLWFNNEILPKEPVILPAKATAPPPDPLPVTVSQKILDPEPEAEVPEDSNDDFDFPDPDDAFN